MTESESFKGNGETINPPQPPEIIDEGEIHFPALTPSRYTPIAKDIFMIDEHGRQILHVYFEKSFAGYYNLSMQFPQAFLDVTQEVNSSILQVIFEDKPRKASSLLSVKKRFFSEIGKLVGQFESLLEFEAMETGTSWYIYRLEKDLSAFPKSLRLKYQKADFKINKNDSTALKWLKTRRNIASLFGRRFVYADIDYRDALAYYLRDSRYQFLSSWLDEFHRSSLKSLNDLQAYVTLCDDRFNNLFEHTQAATVTVDEWEKASREMEEEANRLVLEQKKVCALFKNRLLVEFRRNVEQLQRHLEQIDANRLTRAVTGEKKYYKAAREHSLSFSKRWHTDMMLESSKISLDAILRSFKWQVEHELKDYTTHFEACIETTILDPLEQALTFLERSHEDYKDLTSLHKIEWTLPKETLTKDFKALSDRLIQYTKGLPDKMSIASSRNGSDRPDQPGGISVPVRRLTQHFLERRFLGPLHDLVQSLLEKIKGSVFNINDQLSLAIFNIENVNTQGQTNPNTTVQIAAKARKEISPEESSIKELKKELSGRISSLAGQFFEPLSVNKVETTTVDFTHLSRDFRSEKVFTRFGSWVQRSKRFIMEKFLILIYSRSEGIRIAQQMATRSEAKSITEKALDVVDAVTPDPVIVNALPHHYLNLFSGRSSIGESFWVTQDPEEKQIARVVDHYFQGYYGGILVLGERNSGKTALCRWITEKHFKGHKVFNLFAGEDGSCRPEDFINNLSAVTGVSSDLPGIMNALPHQTVIIIHDLELWWERASDGMQAVRMIMEMIGSYSDHIVFIVNMNSFTYQLINNIDNFSERFIGVVRCLPLSSLELKNMIITRHRSSGLMYSLDNGKIDIPEITLAKMFNYYFNYSEGNPGVAMSAWVNSIIHVTDKTLTIKPPDLPDTDVLDQLPAEWNVILIQLILHKRMSVQKLQRVFGTEFPGLSMTLSALVRAGLIAVRTKDLYVLNPFVEHFVVKSFKQKEWL
jgi:hypothetical protein